MPVSQGSCQKKVHNASKAHVQELLMLPFNFNSFFQHPHLLVICESKISQCTCRALACSWRRIAQVLDLGNNATLQPAGPRQACTVLEPSAPTSCSSKTEGGQHPHAMLAPGRNHCCSCRLKTSHDITWAACQWVSLSRWWHHTGLL